MKITLNKQEIGLLLDYGHKFLEQTGEKYSTQYMMSILCQIYSDNLDKDLKSILDRKVQEKRERE